MEITKKKQPNFFLLLPFVYPPLVKRNNFCGNEQIDLLFIKTKKQQRKVCMYRE